jgi:DNA mismatch endonuclease (patch repair protein)
MPLTTKKCFDNKERWAATGYSASLSKNRSTRDTAPELLLRRRLHQLGLRYRLNVSIGQRLTADILLPRFRLAIFVDGCFWHSCPAHGRSITSGPNQAMWAKKFLNVKEREKRAGELLARAGYRVLRIWECSVLADPHSAASYVRQNAEGAGSFGCPAPSPGPIRRRCRKPPGERRSGKWP